MYAGLFVETGRRRRSCSRGRGTRTRSGCSRASRASTRRARRKLKPIEGQPRNMLEPPAACPFQPRCRFEVDAVAEEVPPLRRGRAGHYVALLQPGARGASGPRTREAASRVEQRQRAALVRARRPEGLVPDQERDRPRPARRGRPRRRRRDARRSGGARRSAWWASRAAGSRRSAARSCACTSRPSGRIEFDGKDITNAQRRRRCARCAGRCRWSSRTRSRR